MAQHTSTEIGSIFRRPITRDINKVVKVEQEDERIVAQELEEYILTNSLETNFTRILEAILDSERAPTDEVGVWISGFFGSGKSHFMKILGYLLEDRSFSESGSAVDIFCRRTDDEILKGAVRSVGSKFNSDVLMFQIGSKENKAQSESISEIIYREFNKSRGYAGTPWVAKIERDLEQEGLYDEFKEVIERETGSSWEHRRTRSVFVRSDLVNSLVEVHPEFSEADARQAIEDVQDDLVITPETLTEELLGCVNELEGNSDNGRYFVFLDEISQFIGDSTDKLLELQSIVEEFGRQGQGKLWLGVTSQEKLEELVPGVLAQKEEETKVGDRFDHRADLASEELDRVIRERILQKSEDAVPILSDFYSTYSGQLSADYKLEATRSVGSIEEDEFVACYPFLPYQLEILPQIFASLRGKGSEDKLTGRERTLIDVTHSVFNEPHNLRNESVGTLVTLDIIFDEIAEEISDDDRTTISQVSLPSGDNELAQRVLKGLYLLQQLEWMPNTAENVATVLYPKVGDTSGLEDDVKRVLEELLDGAYIGRNEEGYRFLSQTERGIEEEIASIEVRAGDIRRESKKVLRDLFDAADTVGYQNDTFDVSLVIDDETVSEPGEITVEAFSPIYQLYESVNPKALKTQSFDEEATIYWIADNDGEELQEELERIIKVRHVLEDKRRKQLSAEEQEAVQQKNRDLTNLDDDIESAFLEAFQDGVLIYNGKEIEADGTSRLEAILEGVTNSAIPRVFTQYEPALSEVSDKDVELAFESLMGAVPSVFEDLGLVIDGEINSEAQLCKEIGDEISNRIRRGDGTSGQNIRSVFEAAPYGWPQNAVRLGTAMLFRSGRIVATYQERVYASYNDQEAQSLLTGVRKFNNTHFQEQESVQPADRRQAREALDKLFDEKVEDTVPAVGDGIEKVCDTWLERAGSLRREAERHSFPLTDDLESLESELRAILGEPTDARKIQMFLDQQEMLEPLVRVAKEIHEFDEQGNLDEYGHYRVFLDNEWDGLLELAEDSEFVSVGEDDVQAGNRLDSTLASTQVIDNWSEARTDYGRIAQTFSNSYETLYERRYEVYEEAISEVEAYGEELDQDELDEATRELRNLKGSEALSIDVGENEHLGRTPTIDRLEEYVRTVDVYLDTGKSTVDRILEEKNKTRRVSVNISRTLSGVVVSNESDIDKVLATIRQEIENELQADDDVEIRFK